MTQTFEKPQQIAFNTPSRGIPDEQVCDKYIDMDNKGIADKDPSVEIYYDQQSGLLFTTEPKVISVRALRMRVAS